jgi:high mobility group protein B1
MKCVLLYSRSAFFFYCADARPSIRAQQPGWSVAEVAKELGKRWENLPDRPKYEAMASKDKERYEKVRHCSQQIKKKKINK